MGPRRFFELGLEMRAKAPQKYINHDDTTNATEE